MAYLDPPYNTGKYRTSHYKDSAPLQEWLAMLEAILTGVHAALRPDGSVWVHLDDRHIHRVRCLLDDVFGDHNYVGTIVWEKKNRASFLHAHLADVTDHILVYAKDRARMAPLVHSATQAGKRIPFHNGSSKEAVLTFPAGSVTFGFEDQVLPAGRMDTRTIASELLDDIEITGGTNASSFRMTGPFRYQQAALDKMAQTPGAIIAPKPLLRPSYLSQESHGKVLTNLQSFRVNGAPTNEDAHAENVAIFGGSRGFDTPKPEGLLERFILAATDPGDLVLDPFAGSGTTLAVAERTGRAWTGVELSHETVESFIVPRLARAGAHYTVSQILPVPA
ncbi:DNA methyltransferase [Sinomonas sp. RB5]